MTYSYLAPDVWHGLDSRALRSQQRRCSFYNTHPTHLCAIHTLQYDIAFVNFPQQSDVALSMSNTN